MTKLAHHFRFFLPVILWAAVIFTFSSYPTGSASGFYWLDFIVKKLAHVMEYGILTVFTYRALWNTGFDKKRAIIYAVIFSIFYGITDEFHQSFTPGRGSRARDVIFDTIGAGIAVYTIWKLLPEAPPRLKRWAKAFQII